MKKCKLFSVCRMDPFPLVFDCNSQFFNQFKEFDWFQKHPLSEEGMSALRCVFDLNIKNITSKVLLHET